MNDEYEYLTVTITPTRYDVPITAYLPGALNQWASAKAPNGERGYWRFKQLIGEDEAGGTIVVLERKKQLVEVARSLDLVTGRRP